MRASTRRDPQRGSAMLITTILVSALLAGSAMLVRLQLASNRATEITRSNVVALHCAEAGLVAGRITVATNYAHWAAALAASASGDLTEPAFLSVVPHDLDGDGVGDYTLTIEDNDDEVAPNTNDRASDNDLRVYVVSRCTKFVDAPKAVRELVERPAIASNCYQSQDGGCGGNANSN